MKRNIILLIAVLLLGACSPVNGALMHYKTSLTGGGAGALDSRDGNMISDGDGAWVFTGTVAYSYYLDADSGATESSPNVIAPDNAPGDKRWILQNTYGTGVPAPSGVEITGGISGLTLSNDTDTDHDINVTAGSSLDSTGIYSISLSSEMTKKIDAAWAAGNDSGGLLNGSVAADTLYHIYLLRKDADASGDIGFLADGDAIATYKPAGYTYFRWIGWVITDGSSNIRNFWHLGDQITFKTGFEAVSNISTGSLTSQDLSGFIPANKAFKILVGFMDDAQGPLVQVSPDSLEVEVWCYANVYTAWNGTTAVNPGSVWATVSTTAALFVSNNTKSSDLYIKAVKFIR